MKNERITENIVREKLRELGFSEENGLVIEEQKSGSPRIQKLLASASKSGEGLGRPEFLITSKKNREFFLVVECKADPKFHESADRNNYRDYAVDGVLLYAANLSREFHVIAVAVSGQSGTDLEVSTFLQPKGSKTAIELTDKAGMPIREILSWEKYMVYAKFDKTLAQIRKTNLMKFSRELHNYMRDYCKITETEKPLLVSGVLLALMDNAFERSYRNYDQEKELARELGNAIRRVIGEAELGLNQESKKRAIGNVYQFIPDHPELSKRNAKTNETPLSHVVDSLATNVKPFIEDHFDFDVIGNFYGEFIRYTGGDKKGLGIVLTPKHITELFADIAKLDKNATVLDTCAGTGGFLISAMKKMLDQAETEADKERIKKHALIGVEQEPKMFALAVSNMILRGDGKTNLYQGSCFEEDIFDRIKDKADAGFINPPYSQKGEDLHEWNFVIRLLDALKKNATGIVIVPMSLAIASHPLRERLLREHRLEAVMSMPDDLFYPVGVVACIMVFSAHVPHESDLYHESWFGYWKDDGFKKDRVEGRIPTERWSVIKESWVASFSNKKEEPGFSVRRRVGSKDEWCAEAYLETNYSGISENIFLESILSYAAFRVKRGDLRFIQDLFAEEKNKIPLTVREWEWFRYDGLFDIKKGKRLTKDDMTSGDTPFIGSTESDNGVTGMITVPESMGKYIHPGNVLTVTYNGSVAEAFYQPKEFFASDDVNVLYPKFSLNPYRALFLASIIRKEKYRYSYGRKWHLDRMRESKMKLPVDAQGALDWQFMEDYIKSLPYSSVA